MNSMTPHGRIRVRIIGAQTAKPESSEPYTAYRTIVTYNGECYERLLRYSEFRSFYKKLKLHSAAKPMEAKFPKRVWSRRAAMNDDVVEERQIMLDEFMKEVCKKELKPESEATLMKLFRIGKFEDHVGRLSDLTMSFKMSTTRGLRPTVDVIHEDEEHDKVSEEPSKVTVGLTATLVNTSCVFPSITSNAETVLTEDERSVLEEQDAQEALVAEQNMLSEQDAIVADARVNGPIMDSSSEKGATQSPAPVEPQPSTSLAYIPPSPYSKKLLDRPPLRTAQSLPVRRSRKQVGFAGLARAASDEQSSDVSEMDGLTLSFRDRISTQLETINKLLSESDAEAEAAQRSTPRSSTALTA